MSPTPVEVEAARKLGAALLEFALAVQAGESTRRPKPTPTPVPKSASTEPKKALLTAKEAATYLSISAGTLFHQSVPRGTIPVVRVARRVLYAVEDLEVAIKRYKVRGPE